MKRFFHDLGIAAIMLASAVTALFLRLSVKLRGRR
jgi:hypothetical protein